MNKLLNVGCLAVTVITSGAASADVLTESGSGSFTSNLLPITASGALGYFTTPANTISFNLAGFDPKLGNLTGVTLQYNFQFTLTDSITPYAIPPAMNWSRTLIETFIAPGVTASLSCAPLQCDSVPVFGVNAFFVDIYKDTSPILHGSANLSGSVLNSYLSNPVQVSMSDPGALRWLTYAAPVTYIGGAQLSTAFSSSISYTYTPVISLPVPEPAEGTLMLSGGIGMFAFIALRRKKQPLELTIA